MTCSALLHWRRHRDLLAVEVVAENVTREPAKALLQRRVVARHVDVRVRRDLRKIPTDLEWPERVLDLVVRLFGEQPRKLPANAEQRESGEPTRHTSGQRRALRLSDENADSRRNDRHPRVVRDSASFDLRHAVGYATNVPTQPAMPRSEHR